MRTRSERLNRLVIKSPCTTSWEGMEGDGARRFCAECRREVHDFAGMSAASIHAELHASRGRLCARLTRHGGRLVTARAVEPPPAAAAPTRWRGSTVAATLVTAWLAAANAAAQRSEAAPAAADTSTPEPEPERPPARRAEGGATGALLGRVADENSARVAGAEVRALNALDGSVHTVVTGSDGTFRFDALSAGMYDLTGQLEGYDFDFQEGIVVQPGEQQRVELAARPEATIAGAMVGAYSPLRLLFGQSDVVVSAVLGPSTVVARDDRRLTVLTELRIDTLFKGRLAGRTLAYRHWQHDWKGDDWAAEHAPGTRVLAFLDLADEGIENTSEAVFEAAEYGFGIKPLSDAERGAYEARLEALARIDRRAERRGEKDPDEIVEWLVATVEEPLTLEDAVDELAVAVRALEERAAAADASVEVAAADLRLLVERFRGSGGVLSAEPRPALLGAAMTVEQRHRLTAALLAIDGLSRPAFTLYELVRGWDAERAREWLVGELGAADSDWDANEDGTWWLFTVAEELGLEDLMSGAIARKNEIQGRWPGDDSAEARKLRQEELVVLHRDLRHRFAQALAGSR